MNMNAQELTIDDVFEKVMLDHWSQERFVKSGHNRVVKSNYRNHIGPRFGSKKLSEVTRAEVKKWHNTLMKTPIAANRTLEILSKIYNYAIEESLFAGGNPCSRIKVHRERKRARYATEDEINRLGQALEPYTKVFPKAVAFLFTLLYSGARPRSIERARWEELTLMPNGFGVLTFEGKTTEETGEDERVILPPQAMKIIQSLPRRRDGLVFGIRLPKGLWYKVRDEAGCPDLWARDLRRTFATVGMSNGVKMDTISELLNHKSVQTTKIYAHLCDTARVRAVEEIANKMEALLQKKVV